VNGESRPEAALNLDPGEEVQGQSTGRACDFPGCGRKYHCGGLCTGHRWQRDQGQSLTPLRPLSRRVNPCSIGGCPWPYGKAGYCELHQGIAQRIPPHRRKKLRRYYGMSPEQYEEKLQAQDNACAICRKPFKGSTPHVDHDHDCCPGRASCGKCVRDLLCADCNQAIGIFGDDMIRLLAAVRYLTKHLNKEGKAA
jgi:Recombination endonuclease VII